MKKPELLAPAGNLTLLKYALAYGADAVYVGGKSYSMRGAAKNFTAAELAEGIAFAHELGKKVYVAANVVAHGADLIGFADYVQEIAGLGADAVIVSDAGLFDIARQAAPELEVHISTQAGVTNVGTAQFWRRLGAARVILARELSMCEIAEICAGTDAEVEVFVHGAMCVSFSGRCLISNYLAGRDANHGACAQSCRWNYALMEEQRPGQYLPVAEDARGTFLYNSRDLCMISHIPELVQSGVSSLKIEGRMKNELYVATVAAAYRRELDRYFADPDGYAPDPAMAAEVEKVSHRPYYTGFFFGNAGADGQVYGNSSYLRPYEFAGIVIDYDEKTGMATIEQRNRFFVGDELEVLYPGGGFTQTVASMTDADGAPIDAARHAQMIVRVPLERAVGEYAILRRRRTDV